jgi:hypothetical protein
VLHVIAEQEMFSPWIFLRENVRKCELAIKTSAIPKYPYGLRLPQSARSHCGVTDKPLFVEDS